MDSRITVRFYVADATEIDQPSFGAALQQLLDADEAKLEQKVDDVLIRAGQLEKNGDRISGDLIRLQSDNLPSLVEGKNKPKKLTLPNNGSLGHHAAFVYDASIQMLAFQTTRSSVSLTRFNLFLAAVCGCKPFGFYPVIKAAELKQLNSISPKKLMIRIADPHKLDVVEDYQRELRDSLVNLRELADGLYVQVTIGLGRKRGELDKPKLRKFIGWMLSERESSRKRVRQVKVIGKDASEEDVPLDFIKAQLGEEENLDLSRGDPEDKYKKRLKFLEKSLDKNMKQLKEFGKG